MPSKRQREIALAAVAVVVLGGAIVAYRVRGNDPAPAATNQTAPASASSTPASGTAAAKSKSMTELDLQALNAPRAELHDVVRDPFRFKPKPPPPPPPAPVVMRPSVPLQTGPVEPPPPPRIPLKFLGTVESSRGILAALSDGRGVYRGRVGDTIEGRYRILRIGVESIDLAYLDGRGHQTIRVTGQ
jgi:hypothetical protein